MTEGSNGGRYACRHSNLQFPAQAGNWTYMDIKDNGSIKDTIGNHKDIIRFHEDTTPPMDDLN